MSVGVLRAGFGVLNHAAPGLAARWAERLFFTPPRRVARHDGLGGARPSTLQVAGEPLAVWSWGSGPAVALVHGWGGWAGQLAAFAPPLVERGFSVVTFDAPAHGRSGGRRSSLPQFADALTAVAGATGPLHAVIAHSLGAAATALAFDRGLRARRAVFLGPPTEPADWVRRFEATVGAAPWVIAEMQRRFERRFGLRWSDLSVPAVARRLSVPLLVVHDRDDAEVPWDQGAAIAGSWPHAEMLTTTGLGHRRMLRDPAVLGRAVEFVAADRAEDGPEADFSLRALERELYDRDARRERVFARA